MGVKKKASMMGQYLPTDEEELSRRWCNKNGIKIYPKPTIRGSPSRWFIVLEINGNPNQTPDDFGRNEVWEKMYEYYMYYYLKRKQ